MGRLLDRHKGCGVWRSDDGGRHAAECYSADNDRARVKGKGRSSARTVLG